MVISGDKPVEYRKNATRIRGRIAIYASLSREDLPEAEGLGLDADELPRGMLIGTVELYDCVGGDWMLREPKRFKEPLKPAKHPQPIWFYPFGRE